MAALSDAWDPQQYEKFRDERSRPFFDLLSLVQPPPRPPHVVDLGCGTGALTRELHVRIGAASTLGLDSSEAMLARSGALAGDGLSFELADIASFDEQETFDIVFSNAALHWLPNHELLIPRLSAALRPGGQLALQMPANQDHVSHRVAAEVAREEPFASELKGFVHESPVLAPEHYAELLHGLGFREQSVRLQVYGHVLPSSEDVVEWVAGTLLTAYRTRLPPDAFARYVEQYRETLLPRLGVTGPLFYPFKRILMWARHDAPPTDITGRRSTVQ